MFYLLLSLFNFISLLNFFFFPSPQFYYCPSSMFLFPPPQFLSFSLLNVFYSPPPPPHLFCIFFHPQIHRPPSDPTSTPHRPYIDPTSTLHRPYIDPPVSGPSIKCQLCWCTPSVRPFPHETWYFETTHTYTFFTRLLCSDFKFIVSSKYVQLG